jgi:hypothetical protein
MYLIGFPLLLVPFVLYNLFAFLFGVTDWNGPIFSIHLISGGEWKIGWGDLLIALAILLLYVEIVKSARIGSRGIMEHMLSMLLFIGMIVEFLMVDRAASSTFFLLMVAEFVDVVGGFTVSVRTAQRDIGIAAAPAADI